MNDFKMVFNEGNSSVNPSFSGGKSSIEIPFENVTTVVGNLQDKTIAPTLDEQQVIPDPGKDGLSKVTVRSGQPLWDDGYEHGLRDGDKTFEFVQELPATEWVIEHNLEKYPSVSVVDPNKNIIYGDVTYLTTSLLKINFTALTSGIAYLN